ncbi:MAG: hypothetical protein HC836_15735 [Richelia sp. RM2_1_2]|nr:hypothetical protein [Richelia sp. RM2_1_2]
MSSRTKRPIVSDKPETPNLKTTADLYRELDKEIRESKSVTEIYNNLDKEIDLEYRKTDMKKSDLVDTIYAEAPKYLEEIEKKKKPSLLKRLFRFFTG